ncbi:MAG: hypothetical protein DLM59_12730, partial [Pseudonocardiales bacterium]
QAELDRANAKYAPVEQVKKFFIPDHDLSQETGELTPTLKVKRNVINDKYGAASASCGGRAQPLPALAPRAFSQARMERPAGVA